MIKETSQALMELSRRMKDLAEAAAFNEADEHRAHVHLDALGAPAYVDGQDRPLSVPERIVLYGRWVTAHHGQWDAGTACRGMP